MVRLRMFGQEMIVLGSPEAVSEMLDKHSANTSDRKQTPSILLCVPPTVCISFQHLKCYSNRMGHDTTFAFLSYGQTWRNHRRALWQQFNPTSAPKYNGVQREMAHRLLNTILTSPTELEKNLEE